jgi:hypothetical protein
MFDQKLKNQKGINTLSDPESNPKDETSLKYCTVRGGTFYYNTTSTLRTTYRVGYWYRVRHSNYGFRVVR